MINYRQCTSCEGRGWTFYENSKTMKNSKQHCIHCSGTGKLEIEAKTFDEKVLTKIGYKQALDK